MILDLQDDLTPGLARAAVASRVLKRELNALGLDSTKAGKSLDKSGIDIDKFSGRLKALRDVAILIGPTLVPLGAATIPALTGALAGLGSVAGGLGVTILALKGVGDGLKALDEYQAAPTAENLQALRVEMEKLGPAGEHFARFIDSIEGELKTLQLAARQGLLPGLEDGIDTALERLPGVRKIIRELAQGVGELATAAGGDLAPGGGFDAFFRYLDTDGKDTLVSFGNAIGDITNGLADMLVAFAPVNREFTAGFESMAQSFADWAAGLSESQDFAAFLDYIRVNGPRAIDLLASLAHTLADLAQAVAPVGAVTLPILTKLIDLLGTLAASPVGTPFIAAVVAITAYSRAMDLAAASTARFGKASKALATSGPLLAITLLAVGIIEIADAADRAEEAIRGWQDAMDAGTLTVADMRAEIAALEDDLDTDSVGEFFKNAFDPDVWLAFTQDAFGARTEVDQMKAAAAILTGRMEILAAETKNTGDLADIFGRDIGQTGEQLRVAAHGAEEFSGALAELDGWLSKRGAIRNYREQIQGLAKGLKDGFNREDREQIDATAESLAQVASQIKDKGLRADFLANARASLEKLANNATPKARAEIQKVIDKLDELGLTHPKSKIDADPKPAEQKIAGVKRELGIMDRLKTRPTIEADDTEAMRVIRRTRLELSSIPDEHVKIYVERVGSMGGPGRDPMAPRTSGRRSTSGRTSSAVSFGRGGVGNKADLFLDILKGAAQAGWALDDLASRLKQAEKAVDRERRQRDALVSRRNQVRSDIASDLQGDLFGVSEASGNVWDANATPGGVMDPQAAIEARRDRAQRWVAALRTLKSKGVRPAALQAIIAEGLEAAEFMAAQSNAYISTFTSTLAQEAQFAAQAQNIAANAVVSVAEMSAANAELREANQHLKRLRHLAEKAEKNGPKRDKDQADRFAAGLTRVARGGQRRGKVGA